MTLRGEDVRKWESWRHYTMTMYYVAAFLYGLLSSGYYPTEYLYLKNMVHPHPSPLPFFVLSLVLKNFSSIVASISGSMDYDFNLDVRNTVIFSAAAVALGNALYMIPFSVLYILSGNLVMGMYTAGVTSILAEITHIHEEDDLIWILGVIALLRYIGMLLGTCLSFAYTHVEVSVLLWTIGFGNTPAILIGLFSLTYFFLAVFLVKNLAVVYDLKAIRETRDTEKTERLEDKDNLNDEDAEKSDSEEEFVFKDELEFEQEENPLLLSRDEDDKTMASYFTIFWEIITGWHYAAILMTAAMVTCIQYFVLNMLNPLTVDTEGWGVYDLAFVRLTAMAGSVISAGVVLMCSRVGIQDFSVFFCTTCGSLIPLFTLAFVPNMVAHSIEKTALIYATAFCTGFIDAANQIVSMVMNTKLASSRNEDIGMAIQFAVYYLACTLGGALVYPVCLFPVPGCVTVALLNTGIVVVLAFESRHYVHKHLTL